MKPSELFVRASGLLATPWIKISAVASIAAVILVVITGSGVNYYRRTTGTRVVAPPEERAMFRSIRDEEERNREAELRGYRYDELRTMTQAQRAEQEVLERMYATSLLNGEGIRMSHYWRYIRKGELGLVMPLRTNFLREFHTELFPVASKQLEPVPGRADVVAKVLERLYEDLSKQNAAGAKDVVATIADVVHTFLNEEETESRRRRSWYIEQGGIYVEKIGLPFSRKTAAARVLKEEQKAFDAALAKIPEAYACYFRSLLCQRQEAILEMERLLTLKSEHAEKLRAVATYRRARLTMCLEDWDIIDDQSAKKRIEGIKRDLRDVQRLVKAGCLNSGSLEELSEHWFAYCQSMILRPDRLIRIGEADYAAAVRSYLSMPQLGDGNAFNACMHLATHLASSREALRYAQDPILRKLLTAYYNSRTDTYWDTHWFTGGNGFTEPEFIRLASAWIDAVIAATPQEQLDHARIAMLQYAVGRWADCYAMAGKLDAQEPLRALLQSRCSLRLAGDTDLSKSILDTPLRGGPSDFPAPKAGASGYKQPVEQALYVNIEDKLSLRARVEGERALLALSDGDFPKAYLGFHRSGSQEDAEYVGECLLTTSQLRGCVLQMTEKEILNEDVMNPYYVYELNPRQHLTSRLFREGQHSEALSYMPADLKERTRLYLDLIKMGEDEGLDRRSRASAYWRAAKLSEHIGKRVFRSPVGLNPGLPWYPPFDFIPWERFKEGYDTIENAKRAELDSLRHDKLLNAHEISSSKHSPGTLLHVTAQELKLTARWLNEHAVKPPLREREPAYEMLRLTLLAARLLPDNDPRGAEILQYAGCSIRYQDPDAAVPAYRMLALRFPKTKWGEHALKRRWFHREWTTPGPFLLDD